MPETIETQIHRLREGVRDLRTAVEALAPDAFLSALSNWSPRDIVAHLIGWNRYVVRGSRQLLRGELPFYDVNPGEDYSSVNKRLVAECSSESRGELLTELEESATELARFLRSLSPDDWRRDSGVTHQGKALTIRGTVAELVEDYFHHSEQIREWLTREDVRGVSHD